MKTIKWKRTMAPALISLSAAAFAMAAPLPAFAAAGSHTVRSLDEAPVTIDVQAKYEDNTESKVTYKVDVEWGAMEFTYQESGSNQWNPDTHQYELSVNGSWTESGNWITVRNHSNAPVKAALSFQAADGRNVTGAFYQNDSLSDGSILLESAVGTTVEDPPAGTAELKLSGSLSSDMTDFGKVGEVTVTVK